MAISYTPQGWRNNSPPAINAAHLGAMDDALKLTADKVDTIADGADVTATALASAIEGGTATTTPGDTDKIPGISSTHSTLYYTWAGIKTALAAVFAPLSHAARHQNGGADEIATATPAANAIPKADSSGKLDSWVSDASASTKGKVQLAVASELITGMDDTKAPTAKQLNAATALDGFWLTKRTKQMDANVIFGQSGFQSTNGYVVSNVVAANNALLVTTTSDASAAYIKKDSVIIPAGSYIRIVARRLSGSVDRFIVYNYAGTAKIFETYNFGYVTNQVIEKVYRTTYAADVTGFKLFPAYTTTAGNQVEIYLIEFFTTMPATKYSIGTLSEEAARISNQIGNTVGVGAKATTTLTSNGTNVSDGDTVTLADKVYTFKAALTPTEGEVLIGTAYTDSLDNLVAAITGGPGNGTTYSCAAAHPLVTASRNGAVVTITALQAGILGNKISISKSAATLTLANPAGGATGLAGGVDDWGAKAKAQLDAALGAGAQVGALPNRTNSNIIGYYNVVDCASGAQVTLPAGGTWAWMVETYGATYGGAKCGTAAGGAAISGTASANLVMYYERIA